MMTVHRALTLAALLAAGVTTAGGAQDTLSAPAARIIDRVYAADRAVLARWQARLDTLNAAADPATLYYRAKAGAWLDLVRTEYTDNDRTGIVEAGFAAATQLIRQLEARQAPSLETPIVRGSERVLDSLWQRAEQRKEDPAVAGAADAAILAQLEVELLWAGNEALTCGPFDARPHEEEARRLAALLLPWPPPPPPPPVDTDGDGVHDGIDQCPATPAGIIVDAVGCPPPVPRDDDLDGVDNRLDRCPGTRPGALVDAMGCARLVVEDTGGTTRPLVLRGVNFETGRADLKEESFLILNDVAASLLANDAVRIEIAGHTDDVGQAAANLRLSAARAESVRAYLIARGVGPDRMTARGYGEDLPIATNTTPAGRAQNRRVELHKLP